MLQSVAYEAVESIVRSLVVLFSTDDLIIMLLSIPGAVFYFTFRGFAEAWTAKKLGDDTALRCGMLTMNPKAHIEIIGFICIVLFGFGWSKPVPTNSRKYKNVRRGNTIQILSGPISSLLGGFLMLLAAYIVQAIGNIAQIQASWYFYLISIFSIAASLCVSMTIFRLIPLPGLDGYRLITNFLPYKYYRSLYNIERYSTYIFIGFILLLNVFPVISAYIIGIPSSFILSRYNILLKLLFRPLL